MRAWILAPLFVASVAHADVESARNDIVDMRKGRMPARSEVLGWTDDGAFVLRRTDCVVQDLSDIPSCSVSIDVARGKQVRSHRLFAAEWAIGCVEAFDGPPDPALGCWNISTEQASAFLAAERKIMAGLGTLTPGTAIGRDVPAGRLAILRYEDEPADRRRAAIVTVKNGRWKPLRIIWSVETGKDEFLRSNPTIERLERSPDGASIAVVTALSHAETDFYWTSYRIDVLPMPR